MKLPAGGVERGDQHISLFQGSDQSPPQPTARQQQFEHLWQLESLSLQPGSIIELHARASDYQVTVAQTNFPVRLLVVSIEELLRDVSETEIELLANLERLLAEQRELRAVVATWQQQPDDPSEHWLQELRTVSSRQRAITSTLADPQNGLLRALQQLLDVYARNQLERHTAPNQLQSLHKLLSTLVDQPLSDIERLLGDLLRHAQPPEAEPLTVLASHQETVIEILQQAIDTLSLENELARFESILAEVETQQQELAEHTRREILSALSQTDRRSSPADEAKQASLRQTQLSRRFAKLVIQMSRAIKQQSVNSDSLSETVSLARDLGVQTTMRSAADHLTRQQLGKASTLQQETIEHLRRLRERLAQANPGEQQEGEVSTPRAGTQKSTSPVDPGDQPEGTGQAGTKPQESMSPTQQGRDRSAKNLATTEQLIKDLWGNLPERQREQILQPLSEDFLPQYATEIEAYFRALAEPTATNGSPPSGTSHDAPQ